MEIRKSIIYVEYKPTEILCDLEPMLHFSESLSLPE